MKFNYAITKLPAKSFSTGISTGQYGIPDHSITLHQHQQYCEALKTCG